jgi:hypothetical protein
MTRLVFPESNRQDFALWLRNLADAIQNGEAKPVRISEYMKGEYAPSLPDIKTDGTLTQRGESRRNYAVSEGKKTLSGATIEWKQAKQ